MRKISLFLLAFAVLVSCSQAELQEAPSHAFKAGETVTICANTCKDSKVSSETSGDKINFTWDENDQILVKVGSKTATFTLSEGAGTNSGEFTGKMPEDGDTFDVQYPLSEPDLTNQAYLENALPKDKVFFTGTDCEKDKSFTLESQNSAIGLMFTGDGVTVGSIEVSSSDATPAFSYTLTCTGGVALDKTAAKCFFLVLPIGTYNVNVVVNDTENAKICEFSTSSGKQFAKGSVVVMSEKTVKKGLTPQEIFFKRSGSVVETDTYCLYDPSYTAPVLEGAMTTVTYDSSDKTVATVDANGAVTVLKSGETVITATAADTDVYDSATTSYTLKVYGYYTKVIGLSGITSGDTYIIASSSGSDTYAFKGVPEGNNFSEEKGNSQSVTFNSDNKIIDNENLTNCKVTINNVSGTDYSIKFNFNNRYFLVQEGEGTDFKGSSSPMNNTFAYESTDGGYFTIGAGEMDKFLIFDKDAGDLNFEGSTVNAEVGETNQLSIWKYTGAPVTIIPVTAITINKSATSISVGSTETLSVSSITPSDATDQSVTWSSDKESIATVDANGKITAVAAGTATITCKANGGDNVTATCTVTVTSAPHFEKLTSLSQIVDGGTYIITYTSSSSVTYAFKGIANGDNFKEETADNSVVATVSDNQILDNANLSGCKVTIAKRSSGTNNYSILFQSLNRYFTPESSNTDFKGSSSKLDNTINYSSGHFTIKGDDTKYLIFSNKTNEKWFEGSSVGTDETNEMQIWKYVGDSPEPTTTYYEQVSSVTSGKTYVIVSSTRETAFDGTKTDGSGQAVTITSENKITSSMSGCEFTVTISGNYYTFKNSSDKYLTWKSGGDPYYEFASSVDSDKSNFTLEKNDSNKFYFKVKDTGTSGQNTEYLYYKKSDSKSEWKLGQSGAYGQTYGGVYLFEKKSN